MIDRRAPLGLLVAPLLVVVLLLGGLGGRSASAQATTSAPPTRPPVGVVLPYPDGCAAYGLSARRCAYIVAWAQTEAGYDAADQVRAELLGDPDCPDGSTDCHVNRTQSFIVRVRITGPDGASSDHSVSCGVGGGSTLLCTETPVIERHGPTTPNSGFRDTPCSGEAPDGCASPVPRPGASERAAARALVVPYLSIPIDHVGGYTVDVGDAILPNGILTEATFELGNESPTNMLVSPDGVSLGIDSLDGGRPFENIYEHGWHPGTERVHATLTFSVESYEPGAVLEVIGISVR
jgi:hypothetical protein